MTTIAGRIAGFAHDVRLEEVPADVLEIAPMLLADTLACAIAAAGEPDAVVADAVVEYAAKEQAMPAATVIGASWKSSLRGASMANCTMARYLDANDIYMPVAGSLSGSGHFSDALPALVATAEAYGSSGPELLESVIVAYEVQAALADGFSWLDRGFHSVSQVTIAVAIGAGRLMGLSTDQLAHAASLAITSGTFVQSWLRPSTGVTAIKGGAPGLAAERGIPAPSLRHAPLPDRPTPSRRSSRFLATTVTCRSVVSTGSAMSGRCRVTRSSPRRPRSSLSRSSSARRISSSRVCSLKT